MQPMDATNKSEELIKIILQHQPGLFGTTPLCTEESARQAAQSLAALRAELIAQLEKQP